MRDRVPTRPLEELATITMGQSPEPASINSNEEGLPFLQGSAEFGAQSPTARFYCSPPVRVARAGSTLISVRAPVGTTNRAEQDYCIGRGLSGVRAKPGEADDVFLLSAIEHGVGYLHRRSQGSTFLAISSDDLRSMPIPAPEIEEQRWIAELVSTIDELITQTDGLIVKTQQIKTGLMYDLFTRGVTPEGRLRPPREEAPRLYKESPLGWIPKEWDVDVFGRRVSVIDPNPSHRYPEERDEGVPICSTESFVGDDDFDLSKSKLMPREVMIAQHQRCLFDSDDVVFARKGRIGLARRYGQEPKVFSHTVVLFKANSKYVDPGWLLWLSRSHWFLEDIARRMNSNSGVPTLGVEFINKVTSPFPTIAEQRVIGRLLQGVATKEKAEFAELQKLRRLKEGLMHDLLSGRVRTPIVDAKKVAANV